MARQREPWKPAELDRGEIEVLERLNILDRRTSEGGHGLAGDIRWWQAADMQITRFDDEERRSLAQLVQRGLVMRRSHHHPLSSRRTWEYKIIEPGKLALRAARKNAEASGDHVEAP